MSPAVVPLGRRVAAEALGTAALVAVVVAVVVGSGIQAARLTEDGAVALGADSLATVFGPGVLIALLGPVSGAHLNPVVSLAARWNGRRDGQGLTVREVAAYTLAQIGGAIGGAVPANAMSPGRWCAGRSRNVSRVICGRPRRWQPPG